jgi:DNA polymerase-3 subunit alpha
VSEHSADPRFAHLHVHSEYSLLDGASRVDDLAALAAQFGLSGLAITDHGVMYGVVPFYKACQKQGVKPIIGCEVYVAARSRFDREAKADSERGHLVLLAENDTGYHNLMALVTDSNIEGFYYKPRVDRELLSKYREGLIATGACLSGEVATLISQDREGDALRLAGEYRDLYGADRFFLEQQEHGIPAQAKVNAVNARLARELGIGLIATNDVHYCRQKDAQSHDVLLCVQTNSTVDDPKRMRFDSDQFFLKSPAEMAALFAEWPEALENTHLIAERCDLKLQFGQTVLPHFEVPAGQTADSYLRQLCLERLPQKYPGAPREIVERLDYELKIIADKGLSTYVLITWDLIRFARERGILVGPGRGSAPGSVILYLLSVTGIDPVKFGIPFERFINPERISMPDVDLDFEDERRDEVIRYIAEKYGAAHVAQIITFGTMGPRLAVRDAGRAMRVPIPEVDRIAKLIDGMRPISGQIEKNPDLRREYEENPVARNLIDTAMGLEGLARHASTHAAGVVISRDPLKQVVPLQRSTEGEGLTTQYDMTSVADVGLLKMDILGLRTLSVIKHALEHIARRGEAIDIDSIPFDDPATFELLSRGDTAGIFQLESSGMRQVVVELKPDQFGDIIAVVALYRPGPMAQIPNYIQGKHGTRKITYLHPALEPILKETYGVIVYQEQVMEIARVLAGLSMASAEGVLRAMRKKVASEMDKVREEFLKGATERGVGAKISETIYGQMAEFAGYGFNKAHSASYAINAYQTAYLKTHYGAEFMAAQLTSIMDDKDKVAAYVQESRRMGIEVLPPDANASEASFTVEEGKIRFGLLSVKHVSRTAVQALAEERAERGPFRDIFEMCSRVEPGKVNKSALESLARSGALVCFEGTRAQQVVAVDAALEWGARVYRDRESGQSSLFGSPDGQGVTQPPSPSLPPAAEFPHKELLAAEKELLGVYLSGHPLEAVQAQLQAAATATVLEITDGAREGEVIVGGIVTAIRKRVTKQGKMMAYVMLEDLTNSVEVVVWPDSYEKFVQVIVEGAILVVRGRTEADERTREEGEGRARQQLIADAVAPLEDADAVQRLRNGSGASRNGRNGGPYRRGARPATSASAPKRAARPDPPKAETPEQPSAPAQPELRVHIRVPAHAPDDTMGQLREMIGQYRGDTQVLLHLQLDEEERRLRLGPEYGVAHDGQFTAAVMGLLGEGAVWVE